jgi:DNA-binding winged helix-turn-helix (wHTH) protein/TolB-like protein
LFCEDKWHTGVNLTGGMGVETIRFGRFEVDLQNRVISKSGIAIRLAPQPFTILAALLEAKGALVTREELRLRLWPDGTFLEYEQAINVAIRRLREALGESNSNPVYIETVPRSGYRWIFPLTTASQSSEAGTISPPPPHGSAEVSNSKAPVSRESETSPVPAGNSFAQAGMPRQNLWSRLAIGVAAVGVTVVIGILLLRDKMADTPQGAVIVRGSFDCVGCTADQAYLAPGIADQLASDLVRIPGVHVLVAQGATPASAARGRKLLLTGRIAPKGGPRLAVTVFLASAETHEQLWSRNYETLGTGLAALEFSMANDIFRYLKPSLPSQDQTPLKAAWTRDPEAYDLYLRGREHLVNPSPTATPAAIKEFSEAIRRDPAFAAAYGGLARAYLFAPTYLRTPMREAMTQVKANALREIELDEFAPDGHAALALEEKNVEFKWQSAEREFQQAISLNPDYPLAHSLNSALLDDEGRYAEAIQEAKVGISLDPNESRGYFWLSQVLLDTPGANGECIATCRDALRRHPDTEWTRAVLVWALWNAHRYEEAADENLEEAEVTHDEAAIRFQQSAKAILATKGPAQYALAQARYCEPRVGEDFSCEGKVIADWYVEAGDQEDALRMLRKAVDAREFTAAGIPFDLEFIPLRSDPRFQKLIAEIHPGSDYPDSGAKDSNCLNFAGRWRTTPDLRDMQISQSGCALKGSFVSSDGAYKHTFAGDSRSGEAAIVIERTDLRGCTTELNVTLYLDSDRDLTYVVNGTTGRCALRQSYRETRLWKPVGF